MLLGSESFFQKKNLLNSIKEKRVALLSHSIALNKNQEHIIDFLFSYKDFHFSSCFSPQHGFYGTKQANMITSEDEFLSDQKNKTCPLFSLYSEKNRRMTKKMCDTFDVLIIDMQDVGCRIYTYLTTLFYVMEDCNKYKKSIIILDRPNPLGRKVEGNLLNMDLKSFVGEAPIPMSHGLTLGEMSLWFKSYRNLKDLDLHIVEMKDYNAEEGFPTNRPWLLPSPNMTSVSCSKAYPGTVLLEGCNISEGRGTTLPLQIFGRPNMKSKKIKKEMEQMDSSFFNGCSLRCCEFEPTFNKFKGETCSGFQIHQETIWAQKGEFRPYRLILLFLKVFYKIHFELKWKSDPPYEYEFKKLPFDILSGNQYIRNWIESDSESTKHLDDYLTHEEMKWKKESKSFFIYKQSSN